MKNVTKLFSSILLLLSFSAHAQKEGVFFGGAVGAGNYGGINEAFEYSGFASGPAGSYNGLLTAPPPKTGTEFGWKAYIGYNFNEYLGIEAGYADYGKLIDFPQLSFAGSLVRAAMPATPGRDATPRREVSLTVDDAGSGDLERSGFVVYGVVTYPITPRLDLFGKAGVFAPDTKVQLDINASTIDAITAAFQAAGFDNVATSNVRAAAAETEADLKNTFEDDKASAAFGLGLKYTFSNNFGLRAEWEGHTTDLVSGRESFYFFNLGIFYQF